MDVNELIDKYKDFLDLKNSVVGEETFRMSYLLHDLKQLETIEYSRKVKVPKFVAEWVEMRLYETDNEYGHEFVSQLYYDFYDNSMPKEIETWVREFQALSVLSKIGINEFEVEEEPKYYVRFPFTVWNDESAELDEDYVYLQYDITSDETCFSPSRQPFRDYKPTFTEWHIKNINENYWPFAVPVEEVNNG